MAFRKWIVENVDGSFNIFTLGASRILLLKTLRPTTDNGTKLLQKYNTENMEYNKIRDRFNTSIKK